jgi:hypothetical protein
VDASPRRVHIQGRPWSSVVVDVPTDVDREALRSQALTTGSLPVAKHLILGSDAFRPASPQRSRILHAESGWHPVGGERRGRAERRRARNHGLVKTRLSTIGRYRYTTGAAAVSLTVVSLVVLACLASHAVTVVVLVVLLGASGHRGQPGTDRPDAAPRRPRLNAGLVAGHLGVQPRSRPCCR